MPQNNAKRRNWAVITTLIIVFLVYSAWLIGPYLQSILVRDAAVCKILQHLTANPAALDGDSYNT
ncbi:hypothetical protein [Hoeflea sp.]|uniref:hypothetical protein n=1 Tax=Hoeflea sp. TaxID=1940281 RepID=UPI003B015DC6